MSAVHIYSVTLVSPNNMLHSKPISNPHQDPTRVKWHCRLKDFRTCHRTTPPPLLHIASRRPSGASDKDTNASHCSTTTAPTMIRKTWRSSIIQCIEWISWWMMWTSIHWDSSSVWLFILWERWCRRRRCILWIECMWMEHPIALCGERKIVGRLSWPRWSPMCLEIGHRWNG